MLDTCEVGSVEREDCCVNHGQYESAAHIGWPDWVSRSSVGKAGMGSGIDCTVMDCSKGLVGTVLGCAGLEGFGLDWAEK